jgi:hypothetical protein
MEIDAKTIIQEAEENVEWNKVKVLQRCLIFWSGVSLFLSSGIFVTGLILVFIFNKNEIYLSLCGIFPLIYLSFMEVFVFDRFKVKKSK